MIITSLKSHKLSKTLLLGGTLLLTTALTSCELVKEDLTPCDTVEIRFVYDYNMEFANAFPAQVDCLNVYFYNDEGKLVHTEKVTDPTLLSDEDYRMSVTLPEGDYHIVAYGGMGCDESSFIHINQPEIGSMLSDLHVHMNDNGLSHRLHNHFSGCVDLNVSYKNSSTTTLYLMRNTNNISVALSYWNGQAIDPNDYNFAISDDNNDLIYNVSSSGEQYYANSLLPTGEIIYTPYATSTVSTGLSNEQDNSDPNWYNALAQFTTSRLYIDKPTSTTLIVTSKKDGKEIIRIPLINYMLMYKNGYYSNLNIDDQEFLDRENTWNFLFFLDPNNNWMSARIIVNDWEVRINNTEME